MPKPRSSSELRQLGAHVSKYYPSYDSIYLYFTDEKKEGLWQTPYNLVRFQLENDWDKNEPDNGRSHGDEHYLVAERRKKGYPWLISDVNSEFSTEAICIQDREHITDCSWKDSKRSARSAWEVVKGLVGIAEAAHLELKLSRAYKVCTRPL